MIDKTPCPPRCSTVDDIGLVAVVAQATDATHATAKFRRHRPNITSMIFRLPDATGTDALISVRSEFPEGHASSC